MCTGWRHPALKAWPVTETHPIKQLSVLDQLVTDVGHDTLPILLSAFSREIGVSAQTIGQSFEAGDMALLETTAHALKSAASSFGALRLSEICREIEFAARDQQTQHLSALLDRLPYVIEQTRDAYNF